MFLFSQLFVFLGLYQVEQLLSGEQLKRWLQSKPGKEKNLACLWRAYQKTKVISINNLLNPINNLLKLMEEISQT